jgi:hypothetical protein
LSSESETSLPAAPLGPKISLFVRTPTFIPRQVTFRGWRVFKVDVPHQLLPSTIVQESQLVLGCNVKYERRWNIPKLEGRCRAFGRFAHCLICESFYQSNISSPPRIGAQRHTSRLARRTQYNTVAVDQSRSLLFVSPFET